MVVFPTATQVRGANNRGDQFGRMGRTCGYSDWLESGARQQPAVALPRLKKVLIDVTPLFIA
jgi:hypothetical protein